MKYALPILLAAAMLTGACVERRMTFTSVPSGALVTVSDKPVGRTPVTIDFTWYGDYEIIYALDGYKTVKTHAQIYPPWYEVPPIDLFSHMAPWTYHDDRYDHIELVKRTESTDEELIERAIIMEEKNRQPQKH